jgi:hypothetical protein
MTTKLHFGNGLDTVAAELYRAARIALQERTLLAEATITISAHDARLLARALDDLRNDLDQERDAAARRSKRGF